MGSCHTRLFSHASAAVMSAGVFLVCGCADFDLNRLNPVRYVHSGSFSDSYARLVAQGQNLATQIRKHKSDKQERERAENEAAFARQRMGDDRARELKRSNTKVAVRVNDQDGYMIVDPESGKPVNKTVYTVPPESRNRVATTDTVGPPAPASNLPPEGIRAPDQNATSPPPAANDGWKPVANLDDYNVVFAN